MDTGNFDSARLTRVIRQYAGTWLVKELPNGGRRPNTEPCASIRDRYRNPWRGRIRPDTQLRKGEIQMQLRKKTPAGTKPASPMPKPAWKDEREVEFTVRLPHANEVYLAGEFNNWDVHSIRMKQGRGGVWKTTLRLKPGRYQYKIIRDGQWVNEIQTIEKVPNPFGTDNCVVTVK
jgi:hypothetical protein